MNDKIYSIFLLARDAMYYDGYDEEALDEILPNLYISTKLITAHFNYSYIHLKIFD